MPPTYSYDESKLAPLDPTDKDWARTWVRLFLRDKPDGEDNYPEGGLSDGEIDATMLASSVTDGTLIYYRPHIAAARLLEGDPQRFKQFALEGFSKTLRDVDEVVAGWLAQGSAFDALIPADLLPSTPGGRRRRSSGNIRLEPSF